MLKKELKSNFALRGSIRAYLVDIQKNNKAFRMFKEIEERKKNGLPFLEMLKQFNSMFGIMVWNDHNLNPTVGRTMVINNLCNASPTYVPLINYTALGTGITAPAAGDTQLETETYRKVPFSRTNSNNVGYVTAAYTAAECSGSYKECGLFSAATASANSGVLVVRAAINITKTTSQILTIDHTLTLS